MAESAALFTLAMVSGMPVHAVATLFTVVALLACWLPARRAA